MPSQPNVAPPGVAPIGVSAMTWFAVGTAAEPLSPALPLSGDSKGFSAGDVPADSPCASCGRDETSMFCAATVLALKCVALTVNSVDGWSAAPPMLTARPTPTAVAALSTPKSAYRRLGPLRSLPINSPLPLSITRPHRGRNATQPPSPAVADPDSVRTRLAFVGDPISIFRDEPVTPGCRSA